MKKLPGNKIIAIVAAFLAITAINLLITDTGRSYLYGTLADYHWSNGSLRETESYLAHNVELLEAKDPSSIEYREACSIYAAFLMEQSEWSGAVDLLQRALDKTPVEAGEHLFRQKMLIQALTHQGDLEAARVVARQALESAEANDDLISAAQIKVYAGTAHLKLGDRGVSERLLSEAVATLASVPDLTHEWAEAQHQRALNLWALHQYALAKKVAQELFGNQLAPPDLRGKASMVIGDALAKEENWAGATKVFREGLELLSYADCLDEQVQAYLRLGKIMEQEGRFEAAERQYRKAVALGSEEGVSTEHLTQAHIHLGIFLDEFCDKLKESETHLQQARSLAPKRSSQKAFALDGLGVVLRQQGRYDEALDCHRKALRYYLNGDLFIQAAGVYSKMAYTSALSGDIESAHQQIEDEKWLLSCAEGAFHSSRNEWEIPEVLADLGHTQARMSAEIGDLANAIAFQEEAISHQKGAPDPRRLANYYLQLAHYQNQSGDLASAQKAYVEARPYYRFLKKWSKVAEIDACLDQ